MSVEKCFAIYFPLKSKTVCTVKNVKWATGVAGFILAGYNIYHFFSTESVYLSSFDFHDCLHIFDSKVYHILDAVDSALYSFGPFALMFITNFAIMFKLIKAKCAVDCTESTNQALSKAATRGTVTVVTVSVAFLLLTALAAVDLAVPVTNYLSNNPIYHTCMIVTQYLNHSINCLLYCIVGSRFRKEFLKIFCRKEKLERTSTSHYINNTSLTPISTARF